MSAQQAAGAHEAVVNSPQETFRWIPVRTLGDRHRPRILEHLLALPEQDRYLRFGYVANDGQVTRYVEQLDFERDEIFGIFNRRLAIVAMAHLAYSGPSGAGHTGDDAEFGVSVSPHLRGRGLGARLFDHSLLHARNRGVKKLIIHALTENAPMLRIARSAGALVERSGSDASATVVVPPEGLGSRLEELVESGAARVDYTIKRHARRAASAVSQLKGGAVESSQA